MRVSATIVALVAAAVTAQRNYTSEMDMKVDPNTVPAGTRAVWCQAQTNTCSLLCDHDADNNSCTQEDLSFECTCASNHSMPCLQCYTQTIPTFICQTLFTRCNEQNVGNADGQRSCDKEIKDLCGQQDPPTPKDSKSDGGDGGGDDASGASSSSLSASTTSAASSSTDSTKSSSGLAGPTAGPAGNSAAAAAALGLLAYLI